MNIPLTLYIHINNTIHHFTPLLSTQYLFYTFFIIPSIILIFSYLFNSKKELFFVTILSFILLFDIAFKNNLYKIKRTILQNKKADIPNLEYLLYNPYNYSQSLQTSTHSIYPEHFSNSSIDNSTALFPLPQAGNTVLNLFKDMSKYTSTPSFNPKGQTPPIS